MRRFRLPRKEKKALKKGLWLYPADEKGSSLMAHPTRSKDDYNAIRGGVLRNLFDRRKMRERAKAQSAKLDPEVSITDEQLRDYVNDIFRKDLRLSAYDTFVRAKNNPNAVSAYYNFVNAYNLYKEGESSFGNICCLAFDKAKSLLRKNSVRKKQ